MLAGGLFPVPFSSLLHLTTVLAAVWVEKSCFGTLYVPRVALNACKKTYLWLLFPIFGALTLGANLLSSRITVALGGTLPDVVPTLPLFLGAVLIAPIAEELLFRGLLLRLLSGFGEGWAILLSALLFALAHGDLFQAPYALGAGVLLGYTATLGGGLFYPFAFHFLYNLLAFFGEGIPPYVLLGVLGVLGVVVTYLLCIPINIILHSVTGINNLSAVLPVPAALILVAISVALTLISGIIPSRSAAKKDPVVALRTE